MTGTTVRTGRGLARRAAGWVPALAGLLLAGCAAAPVAPTLPAVDPAAPVPAAPRAVASGLPLPAWIGLVRIVGGKMTPIPAAELALWTGAMREVSRGLLYPVRARPLILAAAAPGTGPAPDAGPAGDSPLADLSGPLAAARAAGFDALIVHALDARAESDAALAALSGLPLFGGAVGAGAQTEVHGRARAVLVGVAAGAVLGETAVRMVDRPVASVVQTGGDGAAMQPWAEYALLLALMPRAEDMVSGVIAAGY